MEFQKAKKEGSKKMSSRKKLLKISLGIKQKNENYKTATY